MVLRKSIIVFILLSSFCGCIGKNMENPNITAKPSEKATPSSTNSQPSPSPTLPIGAVMGSAPSVDAVQVFGYVYDDENKPVTDALVKIKFLKDEGIILPYYEYKTDAKGKYFFRLVLSRREIELSVSKEGYKSISRTKTTGLGPCPDVPPCPYVFIDGNIGDFVNFGGDKEPDDKNYALVKIK